MLKCNMFPRRRLDALMQHVSNRRNLCFKPTCSYLKEFMFNATFFHSEDFMLQSIMFQLGRLYALMQNVPTLRNLYFNAKYFRTEDFMP